MFRDNEQLNVLFFVDYKLLTRTTDEIVHDCKKKTFSRTCFQHCSIRNPASIFLGIRWDYAVPRAQKKSENKGFRAFKNSAATQRQTISCQIFLKITDSL